MKICWQSRLTNAIRVGLAVLTGYALMESKAGAQGKPLLAEQVFKNVRALRGISVDDFLGTMGLMVAALQSDCAGCHRNAGTDEVDWVAGNPIKEKVTFGTADSRVISSARHRTFA